MSNVFKKQLDNLNITQRMENYGVKRRIVNGQEYLDNGFADLSNVMPIVEFKELYQGCETWVKGEKYPVRGCFNSKTTTVHQFKKLIPTLLDTLRGGLFNKIIGAIYLRMNWKKYFSFIYASMRNVYADVKYYQQPVREVYRLVKDKMIREIVCAVLEFDDAYRYRFQDIVSEIDKDRFARRPLLEIKRLLKMYCERENNDLFDKISNGIKLLRFYLMFDKGLLKELQSIVKEINLDEIKMSKEDKHWTNKWHTYKFGGLTLQERQYENRNKT